MSFARRLSALFLVLIFGLLSVASTDTGTGGESVCGALFEEGAAAGEACAERSECNEFCCLCEESDLGFIAQGCDLDQGVCYGGDVVCQLALDDDPSLCAADE